MGQHLTDGDAAFQHGAAEILEFFHGPGPGATGGLISTDHDATQGAPGRQGRQGQGEQDRGAVGVGDDALMLESCIAVHLRHHQGHIGVEAKGTGVVDYHRARRCRLGSPLAGHGSAGGGQQEIKAVKGVGIHRPHLQGFPLPGEGLASGTGGGQGTQFADGKSTFGQQGQQFHAHGPGRTQDPDPQGTVRQSTCCSEGGVQGGGGGGRHSDGVNRKQH